VAQNITAGRPRNTRRAVEEIEEEAIELRRDFGLPELPRGRPANLRWQDLLMAACVRAFVGAPDLILLENPTSGHAEGMVPLLKAVHAARQRGAAILWMTDDLRVWNHPELRATARCRMNGLQVQVVDEGEKAA
jgi:phospholipid/cholesterol/gamma-HCH transport system ATP-binding protein